jgi:hypothetical protein
VCASAVPVALCSRTNGDRARDPLLLLLATDLLWHEGHVHRRRAAVLLGASGRLDRQRVRCVSCAVAAAALCAAALMHCRRSRDIARRPSAVSGHQCAPALLVGPRIDGRAVWFRAVTCVCVAVSCRDDVTPRLWQACMSIHRAAALAFECQGCLAVQQGLLTCRRRVVRCAGACRAAEGLSPHGTAQRHLHAAPRQLSGDDAGKNDERSARRADGAPAGACGAVGAATATPLLTR